ncbi:MAG: non-ribosomal peptide synthetase, partial [Micromonosporaceae bacterium]|nr:non-ribosomal peptide synthetase [Micromonosporaceae bacterium]
MGAGQLTSNVTGDLHSAVDQMKAATGRRLTVDQRCETLERSLVALLAVITEAHAEEIGRGRILLDSLQAVELQTIVQATLDVSVPLEELVQGVDYVELAEALSSQLGDEPKPELAETVFREIIPDPTNRYQSFGLTDVQQAYLLGRDPSYELGNVPAAFYAEVAAVDLDVDRLEAALRAMIARHDMLRAVIQPDGRQQVLASVPDYVISRLDLRDLIQEAARSELGRIRNEMTGQSSVHSWPLFEVRATCLDDRRTRVHISVDLLITDGTSFARLVHELSARIADPEQSLPELELTFRDYQLAVERMEEGPRYARARDYWRRRLDELPPAPQLPLAKPMGAVHEPRFSRRSFQLSAEQWCSLRQRAAQRGLTPSMVLMCAYSEVLGEWSSSARFLLNVTVNNRLPLHPQVDELLGDFTALTLVEVDTSVGSS